MLSADLTNTSANAKMAVVAAAWAVGITVWVSGMGALALFF
jgi:hypothetical protein